MLHIIVLHGEADEGGELGISDLGIATMELIDGGHALGEKPYTGSLDKREGDDRPVNTLTTHDGGIDL